MRRALPQLGHRFGADYLLVQIDWVDAWLHALLAEDVAAMLSIVVYAPYKSQEGYYERSPRYVEAKVPLSVDWLLQTEWNAHAGKMAVLGESPCSEQGMPANCQVCGHPRFECRVRGAVCRARYDIRLFDTSFQPSETVVSRKCWKRFDASVVEDTRRVGTRSAGVTADSV